MPALNAPSPEISALLFLALEAGREIMTIYQGDFTAAVKADGSPVTIADQAAEAVILAGLKESFQSVPVVAEEAVEAGHLPEVAERYFLVDPLDGTKEFVSQNGEFTVNIALVDQGVPVFGVVYAPVLGDIYWGGTLPADLSGEGTSESGAFKAKVQNGGIETISRISVRQSPFEGLSVLASRSHLSKATSAFIEQFQVAETVSVGSSLKFCVVAEGKADLYPRLGPTMQWDIAAGDAVLRAAGGEVLRLEDHSPVTYQVPPQAQKADLLSPFFVALSNRDLLGAAGLLAKAV
ncbi:3'(2'),5'-bisphosphate nucleotidase CysQ [Roseibium algae]|uniref:3'(2'),5'-bisphosphate nucleotidase CysQ n=1 Tax=Roseibium algae TaxID=3123038 RepID=A0ABU8TM93_9HYPH